MHFAEVIQQLPDDGSVPEVGNAARNFEKFGINANQAVNLRQFSFIDGQDSLLRKYIIFRT